MLNSTLDKITFSCVTSFKATRYVQAPLCESRLDIEQYGTNNRKHTLTHCKLKLNYELPI